MTKVQPLEGPRWLAEGNPGYAGTDDDERQNVALARLIVEDFLSYVPDGEVTEAFRGIRGASSGVEVTVFPREPAGRYGHIPRAERLESACLQPGRKERDDQR